MQSMRDRPLQDKVAIAFVAGMHALALYAPFCMTKSAIGVFIAGYLITGLGITLSYHR